MSKKILLADDSITIQKVISITFASEDYDLVVVGDGDAAIAKIKEVKPDLVIADVAMPGKTGYEVCAAIKKDPGLKHIPVLLLSGTFEPLNEKEFQRVKADDHIVKPFESTELIEKVKNLLARPVAAAPAEIEIEAPSPPPPAPEIKAPMPADIWEVGDFMGVEESEARAKGAAPTPAAEKEIWGVDFFEEPAKEAPPKPEIEEEFIELELKEEELQPAEEVKPAPPKVVPTIPARVEAKVKEAAAIETPELRAVPKEQLEEAIRKVSREVIEEIAWEVIPDMAEQLIKEEIRKIKEAIGKVK